MKVNLFLLSKVIFRVYICLYFVHLKFSLMKLKNLRRKLIQLGLGLSGGLWNFCDGDSRLLLKSYYVKKNVFLYFFFFFSPISQNKAYQLIYKELVKSNENNTILSVKWMLSSSLEDCHDILLKDLTNVST